MVALRCRLCWCVVCWCTASDDRLTFTRLLHELADLIGSFPSLAASARFVIVPGPDDPGSNGVLPRAPVRGAS